MTYPAMRFSIIGWVAQVLPDLGSRQAMMLGVIGVSGLALASMGAATQEGKVTVEQVAPRVVVDFSKPLAKICVNVIRHYNDGWANGFHHNIRYWQIWNEAETPLQWSGTREQYLDLYRVTATAIKAYDPSLKVGGPASCTEQNRMVRPFLTYCRDHKLPLDFFSWHRYLGSPKAVAEAGATARAILDEYGFKDTENHLTEWHYMKCG